MPVDPITLATIAGLGILTGGGISTYIHTRRTSESEPKPEPDAEDESTDTANEVELRVQVRQAARELEQAEQKLNGLRKNYFALLKQGAQSSSPNARKVYAIKARAVKFKAQVMQLKQLKALKGLAGWEVAGMQKEIREMLADLESESSALAELDLNPESIQRELDRVQAQLENDMDTLGDVFAGTNVDVDDSTMPTVEEQQLMNELADGERSLEDIDFDVGTNDVSDVAAAASASTDAAAATAGGFGGLGGDIDDIGDVDFDIGMPDDGGDDLGGRGSHEAD